MQFVACAMIALVPCVAQGRVLLASHFDSSLDADHSLYGEPKATAEGLALSAQMGSGKDFPNIPPGKALDAGYTDASNGKACVKYSAVNLSARGGTIEMWVKPAY